eukprot:682656-Hanusia_phi.AAC.1
MSPGREVGAHPQVPPHPGQPAGHHGMERHQRPSVQGERGMHAGPRGARQDRHQRHPLRPLQRATHPQRGPVRDRHRQGVQLQVPLAAGLPARRGVPPRSGEGRAGRDRGGRRAV